MKTFLSCLLVATVAAVGPVRADEPAIIGKARQYLGSEAALTAVKSIHLTGRVLGDNVDDPKNPFRATVDIIFAKPFQESLYIRYPTQIVHTGLDGFEAWQHVQDKPAEGQLQINPHRASQLVILSQQHVRNLRADTWYNLYFYRGIEMTGGALEDAGPATIDGVACEKVIFTHSPQVIYTRYFDLATGRLVYTETRSGARIRESGEVVVGGIRFPRTVVTSETSRTGKVVSSTYSFDQVRLNEVFPSSTFEVPVLSNSDDTEPVFAPPSH